MRNVLCFALFAMVFLATGISSAEVPDLIGNWTASWTAYDVGFGYSNSTENTSLLAVVADQEGRIFSGNLYWLENGTQESERFAGAIGLDNKTIYITESDGGYSFGTIVSNDEMELIYLTDGEEAEVAIDKLVRTRE